MGRAEKALLLFFCFCASMVGYLTWSARARAESLKPPADTAPHVPVLVGRNHRALSMNYAAGTHVIAAVVPSTRSAPVRDLPTIRTRLSTGSSGTYMDYMLLRNDSLVAHWPDRYSAPIRVWIQPESRVAGWSSDLVSIARDAFSVWPSIYVPARFEFVDDSSSAEITVVWREPFAGEQVGVTKRFRDQHGWLSRAEIEIAVETGVGGRRSLGAEYVRSVATHEVGHALGLDHSPDRSDIMFERAGALTQPSDADRATLALIYSVPPGSIK